jgi:hypothetical protein
MKRPVITALDSVRTDALAAIVQVNAAAMALPRNTLRERVSGQWVIRREAALRVALMVVVNKGTVIAAYTVEPGSALQLTEVSPSGRTVNRYEFTLLDDEGLMPMFGSPSPVPPQRNPVSLLSLWDLGIDLEGQHSIRPAEAGTATVGGVTLKVNAGTAYLSLPSGVRLIVDQVASAGAPEQDQR